MIHWGILKTGVGRFGLGTIVLKLPNREQENTMNETEHPLGFLRELTWSHIFIILIVLVSYRLFVLVMHRIVHRAAGNAPSHQRLLILRAVPIARLLIGIAAIAIIIPLLVEPTFKNVVAITASPISLVPSFAACIGDFPIFK